FFNLVFLGLRQELVVDLRFVAVLIFAVPATKEDAAVEMLAVGFAFELKDEVLVLVDGLQIAWAVLDVDRAIDDGKLRFLAGELLPAGEVFVIEEGLHAEWNEFD